MTHKQGTETPQNRKSLLRLAEPADEQEIVQLMRIHDGKSQYPIKFRQQPKEGDEQVLAFLPDGQLSACVRLSIVETGAHAKAQLGAFVHGANVPALIFERSCALPGGEGFDAIRAAILLLANDMWLNGIPVRSQIEKGPMPWTTLRKLRALGARPLMGRDVNNFLLPTIPKESFKSVAQKLGGYDLRFFDWRGRLPFQRLLPDHVIRKWSHNS